MINLNHELQNWFMEKACHLSCSSWVGSSNLIGGWVRVLSPQCYLFDLFTVRKVRGVLGTHSLQSNLPFSPQSPVTFMNALDWDYNINYVPITGVKYLTRDNWCEERFIFGSVWVFSLSWQGSLMSGIVCVCSHRNTFIIGSQDTEMMGQKYSRW